MDMPLLRLRGLGRAFPAGETTIAALREIDLDIHAGEMVAIVGASGSGKSTLMNILGCLDRPTCGSYRIAGRETGAMSPGQLAQLRREHFGFVFQRYHLLGDHHALGNVEVPAIYAGVEGATRRQRALALLERLGLADRTGHRPAQLSGGQQQRVSIARALMNGGQLILADEPTGALDSKSGEEMMMILGELHAQGHTVILVTHDMSVARHAQRIIEISDGAIVADRGGRIGRDEADATTAPIVAAPPRGQAGSPWQGRRDRLVEALHMALRAMAGHRLRTLLTMLGIIIGIASVVSVVALGNGSRQALMQQVNALGTNTLIVYPGRGFGDTRAGTVQTLRASDAVALSTLAGVAGVTPVVSRTLTVRRGNHVATATVQGVGEAYFRTEGRDITEGSSFDAKAVARMRQSVVIDESTRSDFFAAGEDPIGGILLIDRMPARVIGVATGRSRALGGGDSSLHLWLPYTTAQTRLLGQSHVASISVRVRDGVPMEQAEAAVTRLLSERHGTRDFFIRKVAETRAAIQKFTVTLTLLLGSITAIALLVGGIGIMNIMLVSVSERTREIGVRMAVGARRGDILQQFLIEAVLVCLVGGLLGVLFAVGVVGTLFNWLVDDFDMRFSAGSIVAAFACSTLIGLVFGLLPARNASRLDPVEALSCE